MSEKAPMPLFAIYCTDRPGTLAARLQARPAHLQRLEALDEEDRLILAGPLPAGTVDTDGSPTAINGSLIVARFASLDDAQAWAQDDPYWTAGVYLRAEVNHFNQIFPKD